MNPLRVTAVGRLESSLPCSCTSAAFARLGSDHRGAVGNPPPADAAAVEAMHELKRQAPRMKEACSRVDFDGMLESLHSGGREASDLAAQISNPDIERVATARHRRARHRQGLRRRRRRLHDDAVEPARRIDVMRALEPRMLGRSPATSRSTAPKGGKSIERSRRHSIRGMR